MQEAGAGGHTADAGGTRPGVRGAPLTRVPTKQSPGRTGTAGSLTGCMLASTAACGDAPVPHTHHRGPVVAGGGQTRSTGAERALPPTASPQHPPRPALMSRSLQRLRAGAEGQTGG